MTFRHNAFWDSEGISAQVKCMACINITRRLRGWSRGEKSKGVREIAYSLIYFVFPNVETFVPRHGKKSMCVKKR